MLSHLIGGLLVLTACKGPATAGIKIEEKIKSPTIAYLTFDKNVSDSDTMTIVFWKEMLSAQKLENPLMVKLSSQAQNDEFDFIIEDVSSIGYLSFDRQSLIPGWATMRYLVEPGDSIHVSLINDVPVFSGKGAEKYNCIASINEKWKRRSRIKAPSTLTGMQASVEMFRLETESQKKLAFNVLSEHKKNISPKIYKIIETNIIGLVNFGPIFRYYQLYRSYVARDTTGNSAELGKNLYIEKINSTGWYETMHDSSILHSDYFIPTLLMKLKLEQRLFNTVSVYEIIKSKYAGSVREKIITSYLTTEFLYMPNADSVLADALVTIKTPEYLEYLRKIKTTEGKGATAYNFRLPDSKMKYHSLSDYRGKVVFVDFWYTGCIGCARYYKNTVREVEELYASNKNIVFITICIDKDLARWKKSILSGVYTSDKIINLYTEGKKDNHPVIKWYKIPSYPRPMLIDQEGKIISTANSDLRSKEGLIKNIKLALNHIK